MATLTKHRKLVLNDLQGRRDHPTARSVYESTRQVCDKISFATVYNSLEYLVDEGLVKKLNINSESARFDAVLDNHSHLYCNSCGHVIDVPEVSLPFSIDFSAWDFQPSDLSVTVAGLCKDCRKS